MSVYGRFILPKLTDLVMRNPESTRLRAQWIPRARGEVLEIGIGSGLNLAYYTEQVRRIYGLDPSEELRRVARERAAGLGFPVEFLPQPAQAPLPLADASIDTVVVTWALCSIPDPVEALRHARRVLKPGGRLIFLEHGRAGDAAIARWQDRLTPVWMRLTGGCHLNRQVDQLILAAGFQIVELKSGYVPGPRPLTFTYQGSAETSA